MLCHSKCYIISIIRILTGYEQISKWKVKRLAKPKKAQKVALISDSLGLIQQLKPQDDGPSAETAETITAQKHTTRAVSKQAVTN